MSLAVRVFARVILGCVLFLCAAAPAAAQGFAVRAGGNVNPDQVYVGGQYETGPFFQRVWLQPNADIGWGNDATLVSFNFDGVFRRGFGRRSIWTAYAGGGPAINYYRLLGYTQTEPGINVVGGVAHQSGLFTEFRVGFLESPRFRFGAGYTFRPSPPAPPRAGARKRAPRR